MKRIKSLRREFEYPLNPAYLNANTRNTRKLKYISNFCRENKIPLSNNEELIMNLDLSRMQHRLWKDQVTQMYDSNDLKQMPEEVEDLIGLFKNFDKMGFQEREIKEVLGRRRDYIK